MKSPFVVLAALVAAAVAFAPSLATAATPPRIVGGGVATFDDVSRLSAYFGMDATILDSGSAQGEFTSMIVDYGVIIGNFTSGTVNDDGSVTFAGTASSFLLDGTVSEDFPYSVVVWPGAPKTGRILMKTPDNGDGDYQTLSLGTLQIVQP
jgi:hypothetical protein